MKCKFGLIEFNKQTTKIRRNKITIGYDFENHTVYWPVKLDCYNAMDEIFTSDGIVKPLFDDDDNIYCPIDKVIGSITAFGDNPKSRSMHGTSRDCFWKSASTFRPSICN